MITNNGKDIISRYLLNQVPAYATHIAIGCGATPLDANDTAPTGLENKEELDFEMLRVPITSKGFVDDDGITKVSLTAQLPTDDRYAITEIGLWSAPNNSLAGNSDSRMIFNFSDSWQGHSSTSIFEPEEFIDGDLGNGSLTVIDDRSNKIFYASTDDPIFLYEPRMNEKEGPRHLSKSLIVRGDMSTITYEDLGGNWSPGETHIHLNGVNFNIAQNNASDLLKLAFSLVYKNTSVADPSSVKIMMEFYNNELDTENGWAKAQIYFPGSSFATNHYKVAKFKIQQETDSSNSSESISQPYIKFTTSSDFTSRTIQVCRIFIVVDVVTGTSFNINNKSLTNDIATLQTSASHSFNIGDVIHVTGVDSTFDGDHVITSTTTNTFSFNKNANNVTSVAVSPVGQVQRIIPSNNHYVALDGFRIDNVSTLNPIYKLSGYSVTRNSAGTPIIKYENSNHYIDFRFNLGLS